MKKHHMPEFISSTLEVDELKRLYESIKSVVSEDVAENIINEIPITIGSSPEVRAEWVEKMSALLEEKFEMDTIKKIRQGCYCNENGKLEESANELRKLYVSLDCDICKFVEVINESGAGWYFEGDYLYVTMVSCPCPMLEKSKIVNSLTWCHCSAGYAKKFWEIVFDVPVEAEIVHSMRQEFDECLVRLEVATGL